MRTFTDKHGQSWQAALLDASYGNIILVFSPLKGDDNRQCLLSAANLAEAQEMLADCTDDDLREQLDQSSPFGSDMGLF